MQGLALEMLVDHYPLRNAVQEGYKGNLKLHSMKLLAEAMAGSEVLLLVSNDSTDEHLKPLTFTVQGKTFLIAGTSLEYAESLFVQYLASRVVNEPMQMHQMDARDLVLIATGMTGVDGILFDMTIDESNEEAFDISLLNSMLLINDTTRQAVVSLDGVMQGETGEVGYQSLPSLVLSLLARENDPDERRKALSGYLSHRNRHELSKTVIFVSGDDADGEAYTTLARGIHDRMAAASETNHEAKEHKFVPMTMLEWLTDLANSGGKRVKLDGNTIISGRFARSVLGIGDAELS